MSVLENFLLEPMKFLYQNEVGVTHYSSTLDLESNDNKSDKATYRCGPLWVRYPLVRRDCSCCISFESSFLDEYNTENRFINGVVEIKL